MAESKRRKRAAVEGRDDGLEELNLVEFPHALLTKDSPSDVLTLRFQDEVWDKQQGRYVHRRYIVTAPPKEKNEHGEETGGLPTWPDQDALLAFFKHTAETVGFEADRVPFTLYKLCKLLRWPTGGQEYHRLRTAVLRWTAIMIRCENAFKRDGRWHSESGFHVIDRCDFQRKRVDPSEWDPNLVQHIEWSSVVKNSVLAKHTKGLDWEFYLGLESPVSKRLYRFLDKRFYGERAHFSADLVEFCQEKIGFARCYKPGRYRELLMPAISELTSKGFLVSLPDDRMLKSPKRGVYTINFFRRTKRPQPRPAAVAELLPAVDTKLVEELLAIGIRRNGKTGPEELLRECGPKRVSRMLELARHQAKTGKPMSPALFVTGCRAADEFASPPGFEYAGDRYEKARMAERKKLEQQAKEHEEDEARKQAEEERRRPLRDYWESLTPLEQAGIEEEAVQWTDAFKRKRYLDTKKADPKNFELYREIIIHDFLERRVLKDDSAPSL